MSNHPVQTVTTSADKAKLGLASLAVVAGVAGFYALAGQTTKKVVWPTRKEATQITGVVFGFVVMMAIFLWGTDKILEFVLYSLILGWR